MLQNPFYTFATIFTLSERVEFLESSALFGHRGRIAAHMKKSAKNNPTKTLPLLISSNTRATFIAVVSPSIFKYLGKSVRCE
jgi:hypothetical protein